MLELAFQAKKIVLDLAFGFEALVLNFEIEVAAAEDVLVFERDSFGLLVTARGEFFAQFAGQTAGGTDQPFGVFGEVALADSRLAIEAVQRGLGGDADEVAIAFFVFGEDQQVVVVVALGRSAMVLVLAHVEFAPEDRLDSLLFGRVEEMDRSVDVAVVGHGDGLLAERGDAIDELLDVAGTIEEGVFGVEVKVGELGHGLS